MGPWDFVYRFPPSSSPFHYVDKPYIVAGFQNEDEQEFYIVWFGRDSVIYCAHTVDGGNEWITCPVDINGLVLSNFCAHPAVYEDGPLYIAFKPNVAADKIKILEGIDNPDNSVTFSYLCDDQGDQITINLKKKDINKKIPGSDITSELRYTIPQIIADPTDDKRLYMVINNFETPDEYDKDLNVLKFNLIEEQYPLNDHWVVGPRVLVNDKLINDETDRFLPAVTVDNQGRIHIIFYDDRNYDQLDYPLTIGYPKFDIYYALSCDNGNSFINYKLGFPGVDDIDFNYFQPEHRIGEYIGITYYNDNVWTSYVGTDMYEEYPEEPPYVHQSVIYSTKISF